MRHEAGTQRRRGAVLAAALALVLIAAACGSDDDDSSGSSDGDESTTTVDPAAAFGEKNEATGEPVKLGLISAAESESLGAQFERIEEGLNATVEYANEYRGGIAGRPIEMVICQGGESPAGAQDCANQMVNNGVVAVIAPFTGQGSIIVPILTGAGVPYITLSGASQEELTTPGSFALTGGFPATLGAFAQHAKDTGVEKFTLVVIDVPAATSAADALGGIVFKNAGVEYETVKVPVGTADMSAQMQAAVDSGADAIGVTGDLTFCSSFLQAYQTLALTQARYLIATCIDPTNIEAYPDLIAGSIMTGSTSTDATTDDAKIYAGIATTYGDFDPDPSISTGQAGGVVTLLSFVNLMENGFTGDPTTATVLEHVKTAKDTPLFLGNGAEFTCDGTAIPLIKNVCSADVSIGEIDENGKLQDAELVDTAPLFKL